MAEPPADGDLRNRMIETLNTTLTTLDGGITTATDLPWDRHDRHKFLYNCAACRGDVPAMVDALWPVIGPLLADRDDEVERLRGELEGLRANLANRDYLLEKCRETVGVVVGQREEQRQRAEQAKADLTAARDDLQALGEKLSTTEAEMERLRGELAKADQENNGAGERALAAEAERDALRHEFEEMTKLHDAKHRDWQRAEAERDALKAAIETPGTRDQADAI
jgi:hypothetical protein